MSFRDIDIDALEEDIFKYDESKIETFSEVDIKSAQDEAKRLLNRYFINLFLVEMLSKLYFLF